MSLGPGGGVGLIGHVQHPLWQGNAKAAQDLAIVEVTGVLCTMVVPCLRESPPPVVQGLAIRPPRLLATGSAACSRRHANTQRYTRAMRR